MAADLPAEPARPPRRAFLSFSPVHVDLGDVFVQIFAVALGVIVGFAVTGWNERTQQRELLHDTVANIIAELTSNRDSIRQVMAEHQSMERRLAAAVAHAGSHMEISRARAAFVSQMRLRENIPLAIAWQIAQNDRGLALLPYGDRYDLAWVYELQTVYYESERRYEDTLLTLTEPPNGNYYFIVADLEHQAQTVVRVERQLDAVYTATLRQARAKLP